MNYARIVTQMGYYVLGGVLLVDLNEKLLLGRKHKTYPI